MEKTDVFVWVDGDDGAGASVAVKALKEKLKASVGEWYLLGARSDRLQSMAYMLGLKSLVRPSTLGELGALAAANGDSPSVLFWSAEAVLVSDWAPWQGNQLRIWASCPAALLKRGDLPGGPAESWNDLQKQSSWPCAPLPPSQVKVLALKEFEKAAHGLAWPFGPSVVILEKPLARR